MKQAIGIFVAVLTAISGYSTVWTISSPGFFFSPDNITIQAGDSVRFTIASIHQVQEVSQATWNNNGTTALPGGFSLSPGNGLVLPAQLTVGTHYYVCVPHASMGMKGIINVQSTTGTAPDPFPAGITIAPNPGNGIVYLTLDQTEMLDTYTLDVYDISGKAVLRISRLQAGSNLIDLTPFGSGLYMVILRDRKMVYSRKIVVR